MPCVPRLVLVAIGVACLHLPAGAAAAQGVCPAAHEEAVVASINAARAAAGLPPLEIDVRLVEAARRHSADMASADFVSHQGSDGATFTMRILDADYPLGRGAETIAAGPPAAEWVVAGWLDSPPHRAILLSERYAHVGVGHAFAPHSAYEHYWTADLADGDGQLLGLEEACGSACSDGRDNDADGHVDLADPGCASPAAPYEDPACDDGRDNDADGSVDWNDPDCTPEWPYWEQPPACGLGFELVLLALLRTRRPARARRPSPRGRGRTRPSRGTA
jgi:hypothetical protein